MSGLLLQSLLNTARTWWLNDRIRPSPHVGKLLRAQPGDLLLIDGNHCEIASRIVTQTDTGTLLSLTYEAPSGLSELQIKIDLGGSTETILCSDAKNSRQLEPEDVEVWPRRRKY